MSSGGLVRRTKRGRPARISPLGLAFGGLPVAQVDVDDGDANPAQRGQCGVCACKATRLCTALCHQNALRLGVEVHLDGESSAVARELDRAHTAVNVQKLELVESQRLHVIAVEI